MRFVLSLLLVLMLDGVAQAADPPAVRVSEPRAFGNFVGDVVTRIVEIEVLAGEEVVAASLPQRGQLAYWLELRDVASANGRRAGKPHLALTLKYQLFYVPLDVRRLRIPAANVEVKGGARGSRIVTIPALELLMSPIRETFPEKSGETAATFLKADATAERRPTASVRTTALVAAVASGLALVLLARHRAWWPFHARPARPFTEAARTVTDHRQDYGTALIALHRAFDRAQGERLLAADVDRFITRRPEHSDRRDAVARFFTASATYFYAGDAVAAEAALPRSALEGLAHGLAAEERAAR